MVDADEQSATSLLLLGPVSLRTSRGEIDPGGVRLQRLLVALAIDRPAEVSKDRLIERLWSDRTPPPGAEASLRTYVSRLRNRFESGGLAEPLIATTERGYRLEPRDIRVDIDEFANLIETARSTTTEDGLALTEQAIALWRGQPFGVAGDDGWVQAESTRLAELLVAARELRLSHLASSGAHDTVIAEARQLAIDHPWRDGIRSALISSLHQAGRSAEALAAYQDYRRELLTDLGLEPGPELQDLERRILANDEELIPRRPPTVPGYVIAEPIGRGAYSTVWRAQQTSLDREVAIKEIRPELADRPGFVRRFETEAQLVARLEHPNAVPVHDYWREPGAAFVVMRLLRGGSLADRLERRPLTGAELLQLAEQVGGALQAAHDLGIVHRDVKPGNVLLDEAGNYSLADFGIAALVDADQVDGTSSVGSPRYAAPEQLRGEPVTTAVDVFSLGATLRSAAVAGGRACVDPEPLGVVLDRAVAADPRHRQATVATLVDEVVAVLGRNDDLPVAAPGSRTAIQVVSRNPFRGLRPFEEVDAGIFRGREQIVERVVARLETEPVVAIVGASGSGKSSLARAGVVPALQAGRSAPPAPVVAVMVPGDAPFARLTAALRSVSVIPLAGPTGNATRAAGIGGAGSADDTLRETIISALPGGGSLVLVIDQFEELFSLSSAEDRAAFVDQLSAAVTAPDAPVRLLVTVRADRWNHPLDLPVLGDLLARNAIHLTALEPAELERIIIEPVHLSGCRLEEGLLSRLILDASTRPGALPLLQYTLTELFERRDGDLLTNAAFDELGGLAGSVATTAERVYSELDDDQKALARRSFGQLAAVETETGARRRVALDPVAAHDSDRALGRFVDARLLTRDRDPVSRAPTIEVAHEALFSSWDRLATWLDEDRAERELQVQLSNNARQWSEGGRDDSDLLRGPRLEAGLDWLERAAPIATDELTAYLVASREHRDEEHNRERRRLRRLRLTLLATAALLVVTLAAGVLAGGQRDRARSARSDGETRRLVAAVAGATETNRELGLLLAAEAYRRDPSPLTLGALQQALTRTGPFLGLLGAGRPYRELAWDPDGTTIYALHDNGVDALPTTGGDRRELVSSRTIAGLDVAEDGTRLAVGTGEGAVIVDIASGRVVQSLAAEGVISALDLDPTGRRLATGDRDGWLRLWDVEIGTELATARLAHGERQDDLPPEARFPDGAYHEPLTVPVGVSRVRFSDDGQRIFTTGGIFVRSFDGTTLEPDLDLLLDRPAFVGERRLPGTPTDIDFLDPTTAVVASGRYVTVIDLDRGEPVGEYQPAVEVGTLPNDFDLEVAGDRLVASTRSGLVAVVDARTGGRPTLIDTETRGAASLGVDVAVDPAGRRAAVAGDDGVRLVALDGSGLIHRSVERPEWGRTAQASADGRLLSWSGPGHAPAFHRLDQPRLEPMTPDIDNAVFGGLDHYGGPVVIEPLGDLGVLHFLDPETLQPTGQQLEVGTFTSGDVSPDDRWLAVGRGSPQRAGVAIYDRADLAAVAQLEPDGDRAVHTTSVAWHPDGRRLVAVFARSDIGSFALVFDRDTGRAISPEIRNSTSITDAVFTPDGRFLLTGDFSGKVVVRDAETFQPTGDELIVGTYGLGGEEGRPLQFTDDGRYLVSTLGAPVLVDAATWTPVGVPFPSDTRSLLGVPDGARFLPTVTDDRLIVWTLEPDRWADIACRAAGRNLTPTEWDQYGPTDAERVATCPQWE